MEKVKARMNKSHWRQKESILNTQPHKIHTSLHRFGALLGLQILSVTITHLGVRCINILCSCLTALGSFRIQMYSEQDRWKHWLGRALHTYHTVSANVSRSFTKWVSAECKPKGKRKRKKRKNKTGPEWEPTSGIKAVDTKHMHCFQGDLRWHYTSSLVLGYRHSWGSWCLLRLWVMTKEEL